MELKWTGRALSDLAWLYDFLAPVNQPAAARTVQALATAPASLLANPRIGEKQEEFDPRQVRRILADKYEIRYAIRESTIYVLRLWGKSGTDHGFRNFRKPWSVPDFHYRRRTNSAGVSIGYLSRRASRSPSPVTRTSALAAASVARIGASLGSRGTPAVIVPSSTTSARM